MTTWREGEDHPGCFLGLVYEEEDEEMTMEEDEVMTMEEDEAMTTGGEEILIVEEELIDDEDFRLPDDVEVNEERSSAQRDRSRSPLGFIHDGDAVLRRPYHESGLNVGIVAIFDADGQRLDNEEGYFDPDAHALFPPVGAMNERPSVNEGRRRMSGRRRGRGRGAVRGDRGVRRRWAVGDPLTEVWIEDDDVPEELRCMVRDVVQARQLRARKRNVSETERETEKRNESDSEDEDVFVDALLDPEYRRFNWEGMDSFQPEPEVFLEEQTGATVSVSTPYEAFRCYWDDNILKHITIETNKYAQTISSPSFQAEWLPTNTHEILCLLAFWMMLGIIRMPTMKSCFCKDPLLQTAIFRTMFTYHRYLNLNRALQFFDSAAQNDTQTDKVASLRPIIDHLNKSFKTCYIPRQQICIDESLTLWKGKLIFKQYIRSKAAKFGIKTFELCESATGYLWSFFVYTGKDTSQDPIRSSQMLKSTKVVVDLIRPLLNKGYQLFMDNWFNSPLLARFLKRNGTDCIGTLRPSRQDVPPLINLAKLKQGQILARHSGDVCVMAWQDKKKVVTLSTCHGVATGMPTVPSRPAPRPTPVKPQVVLDYNRNMGGVDLKDQMLEPYLLERKRCAKWYMKLFKRFLNVSISNSRILLQSSTREHQDNLAFRLKLVDEILKTHLKRCPPLYSKTPASSHPALPVQGHWPTRHIQRESDSKTNRYTSQRCVVCTKAGRKSMKSAYRCEACNVSLCIIDCFKMYHLSLDKKLIAKRD